MNKRWFVYAVFAVSYVVATFCVSVYLPNPFVSNPEAENLLLNPPSLSGGVACPALAQSPATLFGWNLGRPSGLPLATFTWVDQPQCYEARIEFNSSNAFADALIWLTLPVVALTGFWLGRRSIRSIKK